MKIVIVGHIDHGKSTLIGRLFYDTDSLAEGVIDEIRKTCESLGKELEFAYITDALQEEREQNITIDTTQSFFKTKKRDYTIIDAPGHKEFIKNMITGVSLAETAILIVSAKEGIQEQTKRHAYILSMLGLKQVIVVINKMDLVGYNEERFNSVRENLLTFLTSLKIIPSYIIPVSAKKGDNIAISSKKMKWYKDPTLLEALDEFPPPQQTPDKPLRFPVQDVYQINGEKILAGRVESGIIKEGQQIIFVPSNQEAEIKSIKIFGQTRTKAETGESIGLALTQPLDIDRGQVMCDKTDIPKATDNFKANIFVMTKQSLKIQEKITLRCATQQVECTISTIQKRLNSSTLEIIEQNAQEINQHEAGEVILKTKAPVIIENFNFIKELGRFILEREHEVVAGGIITN